MGYRQQELSMLHLVNRICVAALMFALCACAATPGKVLQSESVAPINSDDDVAIKGYDPVAYFTGRKPMVGSPAIEQTWHGIKWRFASRENRDAFIAAPETYAPQFGGYCSFAVSRGTVADIDPHQWAVVDGKLYLNNNGFAQSLWDKDRPGNITAGEINWPLIPKKAEHRE
jgi:hypothetical protein